MGLEKLPNSATAKSVIYDDISHRGSFPGPRQSEELDFKVNLDVSPIIDTEENHVYVYIKA